MPDKFCESCEHWEFVHSTWGACNNEMTIDRLKVTQDFDSVDDTSVMTDRNFGCIFHEHKEKNVLLKLPNA
ncbi:hypothetical protein [Segetibacter aerophilus]|uniref:Uncharacterized protein n=1 Tax=Segetibacter aerophilus TaxID=670293 RepID=A0A512B9X9_9BACT|nr:hypothetical protein [Segetibacter aerophilus]GEO08765.1 hypothetical protein SAE01_12610 [Segetibacter aerophilus]